MVDPDRPPQSAPSQREVVDLRGSSGQAAAETVRMVLESAADVIFSDGVSAEFLDQWTFETVQLLEARARPASDPATRAAATPTRVSAGR